MKCKRVAAPVLLVFLLISLLISGCSARESGSFTADTLDGGTFSQKDIEAKDLTLINFWGTYCAPCIAEMPDLAAFEKALPENVQLITICVDGEKNEANARELLQWAEYEGITLVSGNDSFKALLKEVQGVPTTIFLDSTGGQVCDPIVGGGFQDFEGVFLKAVNKALKASGKAEISLEK